jgi:hypothetical protein
MFQVSIEYTIDPIPILNYIVFQFQYIIIVIQYIAIHSSVFNIVPVIVLQ